MNKLISTLLLSAGLMVGKADAQTSSQPGQLQALGMGSKKIKVEDKKRLDELALRPLVVVTPGNDTLALVVTTDPEKAEWVVSARGNVGPGKIFMDEVTTLDVDVSSIAGERLIYTFRQTAKDTATYPLPLATLPVVVSKYNAEIHGQVESWVKPVAPKP